MKQPDNRFYEVLAASIEDTTRRLRAEAGALCYEPVATCIGCGKLIQGRPLTSPKHPVSFHSAECEDQYERGLHDEHLIQP